MLTERTDWRLQCKYFDLITERIKLDYDAFQSRYKPAGAAYIMDPTDRRRFLLGANECSLSKHDSKISFSVESQSGETGCLDFRVWSNFLDVPLLL